MHAEITTQPDCWRHAAELAGRHAQILPPHGARVAVVGCGTSRYMAQAYAGLREAAGHGETDSFPASELPDRRYDRVVALTRTGTTTEVVELLRRLRGSVPTTVLTADAATPAGDAADAVVELAFADERSVVQTRFATSALTVLRVHNGADVDGVIAQARQALDDGVPEGLATRTQFTFLGTGWTVGLANEAALKLREAALAWAESYPAMEYRHGPISVTDERSAVWTFGEPPAGLAADVAATGGRWVTSTVDPQADLLRAQLLAVQLATGAGIDPDNPRHLSRSVILG